MDFPRCFACMEALPDPPDICPHCGRQNRETAKAQPPHALPCGSMLHGRYGIGRVLGQGGFGISYLGWDLAMETKVCIKEYFPDGAAMRNSTQSAAVFWGSSANAKSLLQGRESFVKEARKAVRLRDVPSVVSVWDVFFENDTAYIVMDYIEGDTLKNRLEAGGKPMEPLACVRLLLPVMRDLDTVHTRGIVHRDISPDNIMLRPDGRPVLLDLGAAKDLSSSGQSSMLVTKRGFSPMEQYIEGGSIGPWTDVYAMCATLFWCVTGRLLPIPMQRLDGAALDLSAFPPAVSGVLEKGLAIRPEGRIRRMGELADALERALGCPVPQEPGRSDDAREASYQEALKIMQRGDPASQQKAAELFASLGDYRHARSFAEQCRARSGAPAPKPAAASMPAMPGASPAPRQPAAQQCGGASMPSMPAAVSAPKSPAAPKKKGWVLPVILVILGLAAVLLFLPRGDSGAGDSFLSGFRDGLASEERAASEGRGVLQSSRRIVSEQNDWGAAEPAFGGPVRCDEIRSFSFLDVLENLPQDAWDVSQKGDGSVMAWVREDGTLYTLYLAAEGGVQAPEDCTLLFAGFSNLESVRGHFLVGPEVTGMNGMFRDCRSLSQLDVSAWDVSGVTDMDGMFHGCRSLTQLDVSRWDVSNVRDMSFMFRYCTSLYGLDLSQWDVRSDAAREDMLYGCPIPYPAWY